MAGKEEEKSKKEGRKKGRNKGKEEEKRKRDKKKDRGKKTVPNVWRPVPCIPFNCPVFIPIKLTRINRTAIQMRGLPDVKKKGEKKIRKPVSTCTSFLVTSGFHLS